MIEKGLSRPVSYHSLVHLKILSTKDDEVMDIFIERDGISILLAALEKFEIKSRTSGNHSTILMIVRLFDTLM